MRTITTEEHEALIELRAELIKQQRRQIWSDWLIDRLIEVGCMASVIAAVVFIMLGMGGML